MPSDCTKGYYCPAANATQDPAAVETICADGSFSWNANLIDQDDCTPCPIGKYCKSSLVQFGTVLGKVKTAQPDSIAQWVLTLLKEQIPLF
jgi:hypothetical protein